MKIYSLQNYNLNKDVTSYSNYPSFKMKMSELNGIDQFVARKYKLPIEKFKVIEEFQNFCKKMVEEISKKDFLGMYEGTRTQRKAMLKEWYEYVTKGNDAYTSSIALMIMKGITTGLKPEENTLPPVLNKGVLADTVSVIQDRLNADPKAQLKFDKEYRLNLKKSLMSETKTLDESLNGWIVIPSQKHDAEHFEANVDKLKMLSHDNWCTKSFNAEPYLKKGDFHVYMENGSPKLGVRFLGDKIAEIQGEKNDTQIPFRYGKVALEHIKDYEQLPNAKKEVEDLNDTLEELEEFKSRFPNGIENATTQEILESIGIKCKKDSDGFLILDNYHGLNNFFNYSDIGLNETKFFKDIKVIEGDADFDSSEVQNLGNLETIGGDANFFNSRVLSLGKLKTIEGDADFSDTPVRDLGNLENIYGDADFSNSMVQSLGKLNNISGNANLSGDYLEDLGELETIGGDGIFWRSKVKSLGKLKSIGRDADFEGAWVLDLGELEKIDGNADFRNTKLKSLGNLKSIACDANFRASEIEDLGDLEYIGEDADFNWSLIKNLNKLKYIGGNAYMESSHVEDFSELTTVTGTLVLGDTGIKDSGKLERIGGDIKLCNSLLSAKDFKSVDVGGEVIIFNPKPLRRFLRLLRFLRRH